MDRLLPRSPLVIFAKTNHRDHEAWPILASAVLRNWTKEQKGIGPHGFERRLFYWGKGVET